ncbi:MAG: phage holin family protein [Polyangiaceae bacterium]|nr:phage holin family protein [Polyangiaceae bacterium]
MSDERGKGGGGLGAGLVRALGTMLGLHLQYAQREAVNDLGRILGGALLILVGVVLALVAVLFGHLALSDYLATALPCTPMQAFLLVAAGDLVLGLPLILVGRARVKKPILAETRALVRRTVTSLSESP